MKPQLPPGVVYRVRIVSGTDGRKHRVLRPEPIDGNRLGLYQENVGVGIGSVIAVGEIALVRPLVRLAKAVAEAPISNGIVYGRQKTLHHWDHRTYVAKAGALDEVALNRKLADHGYSAEEIVEMSHEDKVEYLAEAEHQAPYLDQHSWDFPEIVDERATSRPEMAEAPEHLVLQPA